MDPIGFSLENFDAVGRWRVKDGDAKIDAADIMFDGTKVDGAVGLRNFLLARREVFISNHDREADDLRSRPRRRLLRHARRPQNHARCLA